MSAYENAVVGKLRLKGKALDVKTGGIGKKKKHKKQYDQLSHAVGYELTGGSDEPSMDLIGVDCEKERTQHDDRLTPAERRYLECWQKIDLQRLAKTANKSHRDRIKEFNHYLANLSEHYDIPKVGPG
ncbi:hypothetical protein Adt_13682 [Abeliophyllum distichum]|uniref:Protein FAM32A n=1 Tax=Abeliophyllum distichum TaxID=126358 RepID=A0ABD1TXH9_9LAMI